MVVRRLWRLKYKSNRRAISRIRDNLQNMTQNDEFEKDMAGSFQMLISNNVISDSLRNIAEARLRNMEQRCQ